MIDGCISRRQATLKAMIVVLVGYPLSYGPACWLCSHIERGAGVASVACQPLKAGKK